MLALGKITAVNRTKCRPPKIVDGNRAHCAIIATPRVATMSVFTEWADAFDKVKGDNEKALDQWMTDWMSYAIRDDTSGLATVGIYAGTGLLYSINKLSTE